MCAKRSTQKTVEDNDSDNFLSDPDSDFSIVDGKALLFCRWCIAIKAENSFAKGTDSFRKYSLDRHIKIKEHELAVLKNLMIIGH
ncbi:6503_t:CDS:2, partial [Gigaspora margarita]